MSGLVLDGIVARRRGFAVGPVRLAAPSGTRIALLGANGSGKTTLLKTIAGLLPPGVGSVSVDGEPIGDLTPARRAALVTYLPPPGEVTAPYSALQIVALGLLSRRVWPADLGPADYAAAEAAMDRHGVADLARRPFDRLSSGQRQLVLLARMSVGEARLCLLDEPTATLDPAHRAGVERTLAALTAEGRIVVFATHDVGEARRADQCVTIGTRIAVGPPDEALAPDRLADLYDGDVDVCVKCLRPHI